MVRVGLAIVTLALVAPTPLAAQVRTYNWDYGGVHCVKGTINGRPYRSIGDAGSFNNAPTEAEWRVCEKALQRLHHENERSAQFYRSLGGTPEEQAAEKAREQQDWQNIMDQARAGWNKDHPDDPR